MNALFYLEQTESFGIEICQLEHGRFFQINQINLNPLLDEIGFLYVLGRLNLVNIPYNKKHPILLSSKHRFTELLCEMEHIRLLHCGP